MNKADILKRIVLAINPDGGTELVFTYQHTLEMGKNVNPARAQELKAKLADSIVKVMQGVK